MTKTVTIETILTKAELNKAIKLYRSLSETERHKFAERCATEIIRPVIDRINKKLKQENDPRYLAYCIEYALMKSNGRLHA